ncbi:MAG: lysoplasmalogenase [Nocardia sp.]|nr:lysoplasmalogenase [Nocardia sp.]
MPRPFRAAYVAAAAVTVAGAATGRERWQWLSKPLLMPLLAADVLHSGGELPATDRKLLLGSLAAAGVGDAILIDPDSDRRLIAGAGAFTAMQCGYSALWWRRGARPRPQVAAGRVVPWLGAVALLLARAPKVAVPLTAYGATLTTQAVLASDPQLAPQARVIAGTVVPGRDPRSRLALGALLFTFSDALIVLRRLFARTPAARRGTEAVILATYAGAQYLLTAPNDFG